MAWSLFHASTSGAKLQSDLNMGCNEGEKSTSFTDHPQKYSQSFHAPDILEHAPYMHFFLHFTCYIFSVYSLHKTVEMVGPQLTYTET